MTKQTFKLHREIRFGNPWFDKETHNPYICFRGIRAYFDIPANTQRIDVVIHSKPVKGALVCEIMESDPVYNRPYARFGGNKQREISKCFWNDLLALTNAELKVWIEFYYYPV